MQNMITFVSGMSQKGKLYKHKPEVTLRPLEEDDALTSWQWRNDPAIFSKTLNKPDIVVTPEIETEWIRNVLADPGSYRCAILVDGIYSGNVFFTDIEATCAQIHIFIGRKELMNQGVGTEAVRQLASIGFTKFNFTSIYSYVRKDNQACLRTCGKLGFKCIGANADAMKMILLPEDLAR